MRKMIALRFLAGAAVLLGAAGTARAQCLWFAPPAPINFGTYSVFGGGSSTVTTNGTVRCTGAYSFEVRSTTGGAGVYNPRLMSGTAQYNVYTNATHTQIWGDGTAGTSIYAWFNFGGTNNYSGNAYGFVPGGQDLAQGAYSDTITANLRYRPLAGGAWINVPGVAIPISMNVAAECRVNTFNLTFGTYNPFNAAPLNAAGTVQVYCTRNTPVTLALDNGANPSGPQKRMRTGANYLNYSATLAFTTGTSTSSIVPIRNGIALNGTVPPGQDAAPGNYIDTLQVVVNY
jgi:spore coat protein U-like protein